MCCGEVRDEEQSMMLGPLEHGPCFEAPLWTGASRDQIDHGLILEQRLSAARYQYCQAESPS